MAESRQIPNIMEDMARAMELIQKTRLTPMASVLIWNDNYDKLEAVCIRAKNMGFKFICLNYPTFSKSQVYPLGGDGISFSREQVIQGLTDAIRLRKAKKYGIVNSALSMQNIINYLQDPASAKFHCFGGERVMFVDWFYDVRPCMQLPQVLGNILTMDEKDLRLPACNDCNMSWYRDLSMFFHGLRSVPVFIESLAAGAGGMLG
jgi:MoaA/NifB/PqqE/SkfB family radical SAM enzyme